MGKLLFEVLPAEGKDDPNDLNSVLCIPSSHAYILLENCYSTIIGGHMGINKTFRTIQQRFNAPTYIITSDFMSLDAISVSFSIAHKNLIGHIKTGLIYLQNLYQGSI